MTSRTIWKTNINDLENFINRFTLNSEYDERGLRLYQPNWGCPRALADFYLVEEKKVSYIIDQFLKEDLIIDI